MKLIAISALLLLTSITTRAQLVESFDDIRPTTEFENIHVQKLANDSLSSTFAIWVKLKVKMHKHVEHVENVYITEGAGKFYLADTIYKVKEGDLIVVPKNTWHGVDVTSKKPMKVISVQSPEFKGKDRVFKKEE